MKNKIDKKAVILGWIYVIIGLLALSNAFAFTPYNCESPENVYDDFSDRVINQTLWGYTVGTCGGWTEAQNFIQGNACYSGSATTNTLFTNTSYQTSKTIYGLLGVGGCLEMNITTVSDGYGIFEVYLNDTNKIYSISSMPHQNLTIKAWRDKSLVYYSWSTNQNNTAKLYNFSINENAIYNIKMILSIYGNNGGSKINVSNVWINQTGILVVKAIDETLGTNISQALTLQKVDNISTTTLTHVNMTIISSFDRAAQLHFSGAPYADRTYNLPAPTSGITYFKAYLINTSLPTTHLVTFTIIDDSGNNIIENANVVISKLYGTNLVNISITKSNFQGQFQEYMDSSTNYHFEISKEGYQSKSFDLYPANSAYTIILYSNKTFNFNDTKGDITYTITPYAGVLTKNATQNFTINTSSPSGYLVNFGVIYNSTVYENITSSNGGTATLTFDTTPYENSTITMQYFMQTQGGFWTQNRTYYIYSEEYGGNQSVFGVFSSLASEINPLYRFIFAVVVSLILGAGFFALLGTMAATAVAMMTFIGFAVVGFIPWIFPIITGILVVIGYIVTGGNEGT